MTTLNEVINDIKQYIEYQVEEGHTDIEVSAETLNTLTALSQKSPATPQISSPQSLTKKQPETNVPPPEAKTTKAQTTKDTKDMPLPTDKAAAMKQIAAEIKNCTKCELHKSRTNVVPGHGNFSPEIMFIGEAPGAEEDKQGMPFVGRSGQFLTKMIEAMGFTREEVFIGNILKCRPPNNRTPTSDEIEICIPYLKKQISILQPKAIIALGSTSVKGLLGDTPAISKIRGEWRKFEGVPLMPTFHPAYILRNQSKKKELWYDLRKVLALLGKTPPPIKK